MVSSAESASKQCHAMQCKTTQVCFQFCLAHLAEAKAPFLFASIVKRARSVGSVPASLHTDLYAHSCTNRRACSFPLTSLTSQMRLQDKASQDNRANQMNPNSQAYAGSRGQPSTPGHNDDNRANQMNPNHAETKGEGDKSKGSAK